MAHFLQALALRLKLKKVSPLTPLHIPGTKNSMTEIPSHSFGSVKQWHCKTDADLPAMFNEHFPPNQKPWTVFRPSYKLLTMMTLLLQMKPTKMEELQTLPDAGTFIWKIGVAMLDLW